ncbi:NOL1/NOP2/sun family putative RNA methylase [Deferribacter thermophilus]|uniref:NOL1/NOP2/sun family putative RNA methylase n=1 Tax=Deferribacter thermophilus TaxID=53573 RepID=UPI003C30D1A3
MCKKKAMHPFIQKFSKIFEDDINKFIESLKENKKKFIRVNLARGRNYLSEFDYLKLNIKSNSIFSYVYEYPDDSEFRLSDTISFLTGGIYIQNPSSLLPVKFLIENLEENEPIILDMASAPGGKTTAISELLKRKGLIVANEPSKKRLKDLHFNIEKNFAYNVATISYDGRVLGNLLSEVFDAVLLDAPCSNENKIFYDNTVFNNWSEDLILRLSKLQKELVDSAIKTLKKNGVFIYSTCTFSMEENEQVVKYIIKNYDMELIDLNKGMFDYGLSGDEYIDKRVVRVLPHTNKYPGFEGFFVAGFKKRFGNNKLGMVKLLKNEKFKDILKIDKKANFYELKNDVYISSKLQINGLKYEKFGTKFGKIIKNSLEYSSQACWEFGELLTENYYRVSYEKAKEFLKGNDLQIDNLNVNNGILFFNDIPLGYFKHVDGRIKNKIDRYFIRGLT